MSKVKDVDDRFKKFGTVSFTLLPKSMILSNIWKTIKSWEPDARIAERLFSHPERIAINAWPVTWSGLRSAAGANW
jgi:hypothetical protein